MATEFIHIPSGSDSFKAYLATPDNTPAPGVLVIQEIFGINSHIRSVTERFAAAGYVALAHDVFWRDAPGIELGYQADDIARGRELKAAMNTDKAVADYASRAGGFARPPGMQRQGRRGRLLLRRIFDLSGGNPARSRLRVFVLRRRHRVLSRRGQKYQHPDAVSFRRARRLDPPWIMSSKSAKRSATKIMSKSLFIPARAMVSTAINAPVSTRASADQAWARTIDLFSRCLR